MASANALSRVTPPGANQEAWEPSATVILPRALLASTIIYLLLNFVLVPGNPFFGFPTEHDDYTNLARSAGDPLSFKIRPVSTFVLAALSDLGPKRFYLALHAMTVAFPALVFTFLTMLFRIRRPLFPVFLTLLCLPFSFELLAFYYRYTGMITNLLSVCLASIAMIALFTGFGGSSHSGIWVTVGIISYSLSIMAKEDAFLPVILLCVYLSQAPVIPQPRRRKTALALAGALVLLAVLWLVYLAYSQQNPFVAQSAGPYQKVFSPASLLRTSVRYLGATSGALLALTCQFAAIILLTVPGCRSFWREMALVQAIPFSLLAPYATMPNHFAGYYAFNWIPWQVGCLLVVAHLLPQPLPSKRRSQMMTLGLVFLVVTVVATWPHRQRVIHWYQSRIAIAKNVVATLEAHRQALVGHQQVGIVNPPQVSPWFATDGTFLARRLHFSNRWLVFVPRESNFYKSEVSLLGGPGRGLIEVHDTETLVNFKEIPMLHFDEWGFGVLELPGGQRDEATVAKLWAEPNPLVVCDGTGLGIAKIRWRIPPGAGAEIRVNSPRGTLFACPPGTEGAAETGKWVRDGMQFFLLDHKSGKFLASTTVRVTDQGCP